MSFNILNIGGRALAAQQLALEVTGNNMANATTPGYRREEAVLTEAPPSSTNLLPGSSLGNGVLVTTISRAQNAFLSRSIRTQLSQTSYWNSIQQALSTVQNVFQEPSPSGLQETLGQFFASWQTLSGKPSSIAARQAVIDQGKTLASTFKQLTGQIQNEIGSLDQSVAAQISKINTLSQQVATLNSEIIRATGSGGTANELLDQRGALLDQLSQLTGTSYAVSNTGALDIYVGSHPLVIGGTSYQMNPGQSTSPSSIASPVWQDTNQPVDLKSGGLLGTITAANTYLQSYLQQLDNLAQYIAYTVNNQYQAGYGLNSSTHPTTGFFNTVSPGTPVNATDPLTVVVQNPQDVAAALNPNSPGDGSNATVIAQLLSNLNQIPPGNPFNAVGYSTTVGTVGIDGQRASSNYNAANTTLTSLKNARQSATGVDMNQESANMIQEQQSYMAAAKLIATEQTVMQSLLNAVS